MRSNLTYRFGAAFAGLSCLALAAGGCAPAADSDAPVVVDHRFDIVSYNMPNILASDVKKCVSVANLLKGQKFSDVELIQRATDTGMEFWRYLDRETLKADDVADVLPFGGDVSSVLSILPGGISLPMRNAEACGEYSGGVIVKSGFLSIRESLDMAQAADPKIWETLGTTRDALEGGLVTLEAQSAQLADVSLAEKTSCVAIYQAKKISDPALEPYSNIWMGSLVSAIQGGDLAPDNIRIQSEYWRALANNGVTGLTKLSGYEEQQASCEALVNKAISDAEGA